LPFLRAPADGLERAGLKCHIVDKEQAVSKRTDFGPDLKSDRLTCVRTQVQDVFFPTAGVLARAQIILIHLDVVDEDEREI